MAHRWNQIARFMALGAVCSLVVWIGTSTAQEEQSVLVNKPAVSVDEGPVLPPPSRPANDDYFAPPTRSTAPQPSTEVTKQNTAMPMKRPFMRPALPKNGAPAVEGQREPTPNGQLTNSEEPMPPPVGAEVLPPDQAGPPIEIRPTPPIEYDTDGDARDMYRHSGEVQIVMVTQNPADGCFYEIPLCIPGCCEGEPSISAGRGFLGRGVVEYCWSCGFKAEIKFRQILGDVKVEYEGD